MGGMEPSMPPVVFACTGLSAEPFACSGAPLIIRTERPGGVLSEPFLEFRGAEFCRDDPLEQGADEAEVACVSLDTGFRIGSKTDPDDRERRAVLPYLALVFTPE